MADKKTTDDKPADDKSESGAVITPVLWKIVTVIGRDGLPTSKTI